MPTPNNTLAPSVSYGIIITDIPARTAPQCPDESQPSTAPTPMTTTTTYELTPETWNRTQSLSAGEVASVHDDGSSSSGDDHGTPLTMTGPNDELNTKLVAPTEALEQVEHELALQLSPLLPTDDTSKRFSQKFNARSTYTTQSTMDAASSPYSRISSMAYEYSSLRLLPSTTSSFLRPGSRFVGTQQSDKSTYEVDVVIKYVDMRQSFLCGYLCIQNLTPENPELTTYFEGEMIGDKYAFQTRKKEWGATEKVDYQHWARFPAYRPYSKAAKKHDYHFKNFDQREHIFMRWKECFLVPEHSEKELSGASYEGFYYICFSQVTGAVTGYYFHTNSEKWQELDLKHVPDRGCFSAIEFR